MENGGDVIFGGGASSYTATFSFRIFYSTTNPASYHS